MHALHALDYFTHVHRGVICFITMICSKENVVFQCNYYIPRDVIYA